MKPSVVNSIAALATLCFLNSCGDGPTGPRPVRHVTITPAVSGMYVGASQQFEAVGTDEAGNPVAGQAVAWSIVPAGVAEVNATGLVTALAPGVATLSATVGSITATRDLAITPVPVATVQVLLPPTLVRGNSAKASATTRDSAGNQLSERTVIWSSSDTTIATVSTTGLVTGRSKGKATIRAQSEGKMGEAQIEILIPVATRLLVASGGDQQGEVGVPLPLPVIVRAIDDSARAVEGQQVSIGVIAGGGTVVPVTSVTDTAGVATFTWTVGRSVADSQVVEASATNSAGATLAPVRVRATTRPGPVDTLRVTPDTIIATQFGWQSQHFTAIAADRFGNAIAVSPTAPTWTTSNPLLFNLFEFGGFNPIRNGVATVTATLNGKSDTATVIVRQVPFEVAVQASATIGVGGVNKISTIVYDKAHATVDDADVVWSITGGSSVRIDSVVKYPSTTMVYYKGIGLGATNLRATSGSAQNDHLVNVVPTFKATRLAQAGGQFCGETQPSQWYCWASGNPTLLTQTYPQIFTGRRNTCGIDASGKLFCWGDGSQGQLGDAYTRNCIGGGDCTTTPVSIAPELTFRSVSIGDQFICGVTTSSVGYCWGLPFHGALGDSTGIQRRVPTRVAGNHLFTKISAGTMLSACGLGTDGETYCWGWDRNGQLGAGQQDLYCPPDNFFDPCNFAPARVLGGLHFTDVQVGTEYACGLTGGGTVYCWGADPAPATRTCGFTPCTTTPTLLPGGVQFASIAIGHRHACGLTSDGTAYCWGNIGKKPVNPTALDTSLKFKELTSGVDSTCGIAMDGGVYCWGALGNGNPAPNPIVSQ
jgi:alpha-tubulin suppressor-like RCC1 family protein